MGVIACPLCLSAPSPAAPSPAPPEPCLLCRRTGLEPSAPSHPGGGLAPALGGGRVWGPRDGWLAAIEAAVPGTEIQLGAGTFRLHRPLRLAHDVAIAGAGAARTLLVGETEEPALITVAGATVAVAGLSIRQRVGWVAQLRQDRRCDLVVVEAGRLDANGCAFDRLEGGVTEFAPAWYDKAGGTAIRVQGMASAALVGCWFAPAKPRGQDTTGVEILDEGRVAALRCRFARLERGAACRGASSLVAIECRFDANAWGVECSPWVDGASTAPAGMARAFLSNTFVGHDLALLAAGAVEATVRGNVFQRNQAAIVVREVGARLEGNVFRHNGLDVHAPVGGVS